MQTVANTNIQKTKENLRQTVANCNNQKQKENWSKLWQTAISKHKMKCGANCSKLQYPNLNRNPEQTSANCNIETQNEIWSKLFQTTISKQKRNPEQIAISKNKNK